MPLAEVITADLGAPLAFSRDEQVGTPIAVLASYVELLGSYNFGGDRVGNSLIVREPAGVAGAITPWNYPLYQIINKMAAALAAGCPMVLKTTEVAPLAAYELASIVHEAGLPAGVFNLLCGTGPVVGEALARHPGVDLVSFTGSTRAGTRVAELAAATVKRVSLELGGKSANVVLPDADLGTAVERGMARAFANSGQGCSALTRMLVPPGGTPKRWTWPWRRPGATRWATRWARAPAWARWCPPSSGTGSAATSSAGWPTGHGW